VPVASPTEAQSESGVELDFNFAQLTVRNNHLQALPEPASQMNDT
jgi:hypothetical protein